MAKLPYFTWYPTDAETDQDWIAMPYEARGVYMTLLNRSWTNNGIPSDLKDLARQLAIPFVRFQKIWERIGMKFFQGEDGKLYNNRQEKERAKALGKSEKSSAAAVIKWEKQRSAEAMHPDMRPHTVCITDAIPRAYDSDSVSDSSVVSKTENDPSVDVPEFDVPAAFEQFWESYPQAGRERKNLARSAFFDKLSDRAPPARAALFAEIMAGLERWKESARWSRGSVHAIANFIGEGLWKEDPLSAKEAAVQADRARQGSQASRMPDLFG